MNYLIGPWLFSPAHYQISSNNICRELDPLSFKLLSYFVANAHQIISRDDLIEHVWQQPFVDDNAINRAISGLRKLLKHDGFDGQFIKTHHRKGYSLVVTVTEAAETVEQKQETNQPEEQHVAAPSKSLAEQTANEQPHSEANTQPTQPPSINNRSRRFIHATYIGIFIVSIVVGMMWLSKSNDTSQTSGTDAKEIITPVDKVTVTAATWNIGAEGNPVASPDGMLFAYSNLHDNQVDALVKRTHDQHEIKIEYPGFNVGVLSWQLASRNLLTLLTNEDKSECYYATVDLSSFPKQGDVNIVMSCEARAHGYAQISENGHYLYFAKYVSETTGNALYRHHIEKGVTDLLIPTFKPGNGVLHLKLSLDGKRLAYLMSEYGQPLKLYLYDFSSMENKLLFQAKNTQIGFAFDWSRDNQFIYFADASQIYKIQSSTGAADYVELPQNIKPFYLAVENDNQVLVSERDTQQLSVVRYSGGFDNQTPEIEALFESESDSYYALPSRLESNHLYFVSNRSGSNQIWQKNGDNLEQLTRFTSPASIGQPMMSSNEEFILFKHNKTLKFIELNNKKIHTVEELKNIDVDSYVWTKDSLGILYTQVIGEESQIWHFDMRTRDLTRYNNLLGRKLISDENNEIYYSHADQLIHLDGSESFPLNIPLAARIFSTINQKYFYSSDGISALYRMDLSNGKVEQIHIPHRIRAMSVDNGQLLLSTSTWKNTHIKRILW
ncbi:winged helix-turn-helix domain-containing protein [Thalassotalea fusca]